MDFLRRLFGGESAPADPALLLYVRCGKCGTPLRVRVDIRNELAPEFEGDGISGYVLRKEMMDGKCFRLMYATLHFDGRRREVSREIEGGTFISAEEFAALTPSQPMASS